MRESFDFNVPVLVDKLAEVLESLYVGLMELDYVEKAYYDRKISPEEYLPLYKQRLAVIGRANSLLKNDICLDDFFKHFVDENALRDARLRLASKVPATKLEDNAYIKSKISRLLGDLRGILTLNTRDSAFILHHIDILRSLLNSAKFLPKDFVWKENLNQWFLDLSSMTEGDNISDQQMDKLHHDIDEFDLQFDQYLDET